MAPIVAKKSDYLLLHGVVFLTALVNYLFHVLGGSVEVFIQWMEYLGIPDVWKRNGEYHSTVPYLESMLSALVLVSLQIFLTLVTFVFLIARRIASAFLSSNSLEIESFGTVSALALSSAVWFVLFTPFGGDALFSTASKISVAPFWLKLLFLTFWWPFALSGAVLCALEPSRISKPVGSRSAS